MQIGTPLRKRKLKNISYDGKIGGSCWEKFYEPNYDLGTDAGDLSLFDGSNFRFDNSTGSTSISVSGGNLVVTASGGGEQSIDFLTRGTTGETGRYMNFDAIHDSMIASAYQSSITKIRIRGSGTGTVVLQLKTSGGSPSTVYTSGDTALASEVEFTLSGTLTDVREILFTFKGTTSYSVSSFDIYITSPELEWSLWTFVQCFAQLMRCYNHTTGGCADKARAQENTYDNITGMGWVPIAAVAAHDLGIISETDRNTLIDDSAARLDAVATVLGIPVHFANGTSQASGSEYSTLDAGSAIVPALQAALIAGRSSQVTALKAMADAIVWDTMFSTGNVAYGGVDDDGSTVTTGVSYSRTDGEWGLTCILANLQNTNFSGFTKNTTFGTFRKRWFPAYWPGLLFPEFRDSTDGNGNDWKAANITLAQDQWGEELNAYSGIGEGWCVNADGTISYPHLDLDPKADTVNGESGFRQIDSLICTSMYWPEKYKHQLNQQLEDHVFSWLAGPTQSVRMVNNIPTQRHSWATSLRAGFMTMGAYQLYRAVNGGTNVLDTWDDSDLQGAIDSALENTGSDPADPVIDSITPNTGSTAGSETIVIKGNGLRFATGVTIDGSACTILNNSNVAIVCTTPAGTAGAKDVAVTNFLGTGTSAGGFTYS